MSRPEQNRPVDLSEVPDGVEEAMAAEDAATSPEEKRNATDPDQEGSQSHPDRGRP